MNVDSTRSAEIQPLESAREKSGAKGTGFPALMEAMLGRPSEQAKASRPQADESAEKGARPRPQRAESGPVRKHAKREGESEIAADEKPSANPTHPARSGAKAGADVEGEKNARPAAAGETTEGVAPTDAAAWQIAAALAVPELVAMASGVAVDPEAQVEGEASTDATAETAAAESGREVVVSAPVPTEEIDLADAAVRPSPIVDAGAREAAVAVVEAAASKGAEENDPSAMAAAEPAVREVVEQVVRSAADAAGIRAESRELRPPVASRDGRTNEVAAPERAANREVLPPNTTASADVGSDGSSRDGQAPAQARTNTPDTRANADASALGGVSTQAPINTLVEPTVRGGESTAQVGLDATTPSAPTPATEAATSTLPARAEAGHAADAIAIQADWLATRGGGSARLVLHPPELGEIVIRVSVRQQAVDVVMVAQTALAHSMAEDQSDRLAQAFAHRDLRLDQFEVRRADPSDSSSTGQFGSSDGGARERERAEDQGGVQDGAAGRGARQRRAGAVEAAVTPPRFVSSERAAGVDLRI